MSPVHVIVGEDVRAEQMWANAFTGAVDLYRFPRNVDAFERLTAAEAPIDLVILTPAQRGPFNLTPDQFVARLLEGPLGSSRCLANLHVIVVGQPLQRSHPRVMSVSTLDAAIRLVKFGEVERAPRPEAPSIPVVGPAGTDRASRLDPRRTSEAVVDAIDDLTFAGSVISSIWDVPRRDHGAAPAHAQEQHHDIVEDDASDDGFLDVLGGGPAAAAAAPAPAPHAQLFSRTAPAGFVMPAAAAATVARQPTHQPVAGGGQVASAAIPIGAPGEAIEVATGMLQPARAYQLEGGAGYRGPAVRRGTVHGAGYDAGGQPVPPALASQVESMVYGGMHVGNPNDPLLVWSSVARGEAPPTGQVAPVPMSVPQQQRSVTPIQAQPMQPVRTVPMEPPAGAYAPAPHVQSATQPQQPSADPFLRRAESGGGDVSFG
jgi:hypothetical protein